MKKKIIALAVIMTMIFSQFSLITFANDANRADSGTKRVVTLNEDIGMLQRGAATALNINECHVEEVDKDGITQSSGDYTVTDVRFKFSNFGNVTRDAENNTWVVTPTTCGKTYLEFWIDYNGTTIIHDEFVQIIEYDDDDVWIQFENDDYLFFGETVDFTVGLGDNINIPAGATYEWSFAEEASAQDAVLTPNGSSATVRFRNGADENDSATVNVILKVLNGENLLAYDEVSLTARTCYYNIELESELSTSISAGSTATFKPLLMRITPDNREGIVVDNATFSIYLNGVSGTAENDDASITASGNGSYTVTRKTDTDFTLTIDAFAGESTTPLDSAEYPFIALDESKVNYDLPEDTTIFVNEALTLDYECTGLSGESDDPESDMFYYNITSVTAPNAGLSVIINRVKSGDEDYWEIKGKEGEYVIEMVYTDHDKNSTKTHIHTFKLVITNDMYTVELSCSNTTMLPGDSTKVSAAAVHRDSAGKTYKDYELSWSLEGALADAEYAFITPNSDDSATFSFFSLIDFEKLPTNDWTVTVVVEMKKDGVVKATDRYEIALNSFYYVIEPKSLNNFEPRKTIMFSPKARLHKFENGGHTIGTDEDVYYMLEFDEDIIYVNGIKESYRVEIHPEELEVYKPPFFITRVEPEPFELEVTAYKKDQNGNFVELDGTYMNYSFEGLTDIAETEIANIKQLTYNGEARKPGVKVIAYDEDLDDDVTLVKNRDYTLSYGKNTDVGKGTVTITGKGRFFGKVTKTFKIVPKGTSIKKCTGLSKGIKVQWKKQTSQTTGYIIQYAKDKKFKKRVRKKTVKKNKKLLKLTGLSKNTTYYVRICTYKTVNGKKYCSSWSSTKKVTTKK